MKNTPLNIGSITIEPGEKLTVGLKMPQLYSCAPLHLPLTVIHGKMAGPTLVVVSALHGDEYNGIAIIQNLIESRSSLISSGTIILAPIVNVYGLIHHSHYLPDGKSLENAFPGNSEGSYSSKLASLVFSEILAKADVCIELCTGDKNMNHMPHVVTSQHNIEALNLAREFGAPLIVHDEGSSGFLWMMQEHSPHKIPVIKYITGESTRLDEKGIKLGTRGLNRIIGLLGMTKSNKKIDLHPPYAMETIQKVRAPFSGITRLTKKPGQLVKKNERIASLHDPFGSGQKEHLYAPFDGIVTSLNSSPLPHEGDIVAEIAKIAKNEPIVPSIEQWAGSSYAL